MLATQSSTSVLTNEIINQWFSKLISEIRVDKEMMEADVVPADTKQFYTDAITGNVDAMHNYARVNSTKYFIYKIVEDYFKELQSFKATPNKLAFDFSDAKILVWAEIADDDDKTEKALILSEAKANAKYSDNGFFVSTTIVEENDHFKVPAHYHEIQIDGRLSSSYNAS